MSQFDEAVRGDGISIGYVKELTKALNDLRKENQLCDIVINVGERSFNAHRGVLAASSSYFKAMLTSGFTEANQDVITIVGKAEHFEMLLQYIYTGKLDVSWTTSQDDICGILQMANYLLLMDAVSNCTSLIQDLYEDFTVEQMPIKVAFKYLLVAKANDLVDLVKSSERRLQDNLMMLKKCKVFLEDASVEFMEEFLSGENLATADEEEEVLMLVLEWLKFDWDNRRPHTYRLLQKVRLGLVPEDRCNELLDESILAIPECKILIDKVDQLMDDDTVSEQVMALRKPELFATRSTVTAPVSIETRKYSLSYEKTYFRYYNAKKQVWEKMAGLDLFPFTFHARPEDKFFPGGLQFHALVEVDFKLYMAGGKKTDSRNHRQNFFCYDPEINQWTRNELPSMISARYRFPLVHLDGWIYAIGGSGPDGHPIHDVERYDLKASRWESVAPIDTGGSDYELLTAVGHEGKLLVYGISSSCPVGILGLDRSSFDSDPRFQLTLKIYLPGVNKWQTVLTEEHPCDSPVFRRPPSLLVHNDICYRIVHHHTPGESLLLSRPVVNVLEFEHRRRKVTVNVGEDIKQDYIPDNKAFAFRIHDEVFATEIESVFNTGIKIDDEQSTDVDLSKVGAAVREPDGSPWDGTSSTIVTLTFDKRIMNGEVEVE